ncbi:hypothetical protein KEM55_008970 [Ascosphaera atra]|nr:hypothetical protein KEM55_008970 [Ascosphaera atra]
MPSQSPIVAWAVPRLAKLLPLDEESLTQMLDYTNTLSTEDAAAHLENILGDSPATLEFISSYNGMRRGAGHSDLTPAPAAQGPSTKGSSASTSRTQARNPSPGPAAKGDKGKGSARPAKNSPASAGQFISEYLPNVRSKAAREKTRGSSGAAPGTSKSSRSKGTPATTTTTNNIADITSAIAALEIQTNPTLSGKRQKRKCTCNGSIHPLFTTAPNCLNCGKIICALEGLQPCSFCGKPLLSSGEVQEIIRELRTERGNEKMRVHNEGQQKHTGGGPSSSRDSTWDTAGLAAAKAHRDKLLSFQAQNAQRTKVVDEAADFETPNIAFTQWMTPAQRALALKKQQRILREMEEKAKPEWERKKMVMSLDVKTGKMVKQLVDKGHGGTAEDEEMNRAEEEERALEERLEAEADASASAHKLESGGGAFGHNPLLASGGLTRPVWNPKGKEPATRSRVQKQTWRRVQDDNDDNEQWILDGGLHGYEDESDQVTTDEPPSSRFSVV